MAAVASSQQSFLINILSSTYKPQRSLFLKQGNLISCKHPAQDDDDRKLWSSRTNIYINPPVAPPLVGGYGYGYGVPFYGGWGWSPFSFFAPGPSVAVGIGGGFDLLALFLFLGAVAAVVRRFFGSRNEEDDY
ncbi:hypothetical protein CRG98_048192 [Punica granatum]|uniref:Uncharacterized protein n=1 Tax=Punica granatum TaxID=22663 RepID=A0A2I0HJA1_PUNGR|nr:hypothetical protein CRG98_048192 [Punica granatum]